MKYTFIVDTSYKPYIDVVQVPRQLSDLAKQTVSESYQVVIEGKQLTLYGYGEPVVASLVEKGGMNNPFHWFHGFFGRDIVASYQGDDIVGGWLFIIYRDGTGVLEIFGSGRPLLEIKKGRLHK